MSTDVCSKDVKKRWKHESNTKVYLNLIFSIWIKGEIPIFDRFCGQSAKERKSHLKMPGPIAGPGMLQQL